MEHMTTETAPTTAPATAPAPGAPAAAPAAAPPAGSNATPPPAGEVITMTPAILKERLERSNEAYLKSLGFESPADIAAMKAKTEELAAAETERQRAEMTEVDRLKTERAEFEARATAAEAAQAQALTRAATTELCATMGVKDLEYARYRLGQLPEGADQAAEMKKWIEDPTERVRFGIDAGAAPAAAPASTTATNPATSAPAPGATKAPAASDVSKMSKAEFAAYKRNKHGY